MMNDSRDYIAPTSNKLMGFKWLVSIWLLKLTLMTPNNLLEARLWLPNNLLESGLEVAHDYDEYDLSKALNLNDNQVIDGQPVGLRQFSSDLFRSLQNTILDEPARKHFLFGQTTTISKPKKLIDSRNLKQQITGKNFTLIHGSKIARLMGKRAHKNLVEDSEQQHLRQPPVEVPSLAYLIAPISEQIIPINSDRLTKGSHQVDGSMQNVLTPILGETKNGYKLALEQYLSDSSANENHRRLFTSWPDVVDSVAMQSQVKCRTVKATIQVQKDDLDRESGQPLRTCSGLIQLNRCEGFCSSSVQPSIKSRTGFKKRCSCCNEGAFRRIQVRLTDCIKQNNSDLLGLSIIREPLISSESLANVRRLDLGRQPDGTNNNANTQLDQTESDGLMSLQQQQLRQPPMGYMDVDIEEPIDCNCRQCDSIL